MLCVDLILTVQSLFLGIVVSLRIRVEGVVLSVFLNVDARPKVVLSIVVLSLIGFRNDKCIHISVLNQFAVLGNGLVHYALVGLWESGYIGWCEKFDGLFQQAAVVVLGQIVVSLFVGNCLAWEIWVFDGLRYWSLDSLKNVCRKMQVFFFGGLACVVI